MQIQTGLNVRPLPRVWFSFRRPEEAWDKRSQDCPCDCACSHDSSKASFPDVASALEQIRVTPSIIYQISSELYRDTVDGNVVINGQSSAGLVVLDERAVGLLNGFKVPRSVLQVQKLLCDWDRDLLARLAALFIAFDILVPEGQSETSKRVSNESPVLSAWLHLTDACPLECIYCYMRERGYQSSGQSQVRWMNADIAQRAAEAIFYSAVKHGFSRVKLKYAGGEPSLNFTALLAAQQRAEQLASNLGLTVEAVLISSGFFLSDYQMDLLREHAVNVTISLDGIGEAHDQQRPLVNGGGSFRFVENTIERLSARGIKPHISLTITGRNIETLPATLGYILDHGLTITLNFYREHDPSNSRVNLQASQEEMVVSCKYAFQVIERKLPSYSFLSSFADRINLRVPHSYPCGVGRNYLVIDPVGNIFKCQMAMDTPVTNICDTKDPLTLVRADPIGIQNLPIDKKEECRDCIWKYYCAGGCPWLAYCQSGRYDTHSAYCEVYRAIIPEILRLEALRLLEYMEPWDFSI